MTSTIICMSTMATSIRSPTGHLVCLQLGGSIYIIYYILYTIYFILYTIYYILYIINYILYSQPAYEAQLATLCVCSLVAPYIAPLYYTHPSSSYKYKYKYRHLGETLYTITFTLFVLITNMITNKERISILHTFHCQSEILIPHQE